MSGNDYSRVKFHSFEADLHTRELWKNATRVKLVGQPFEVLAILLATPGELVTREELGTRLWPSDTFVDFNHGLNAAVNKLREALGDSAESPRYIETLPRRGYRFIAPIEAVSSTEQLQCATSIPELEPTQSAPGGTTSLTDQQPFGRAVHHGLRYVWGALGLLALITGVTFLFIKNGIFVGKEAGASPLPAQPPAPATNMPDETSEPAFSADGNYLAFRREATRREQAGIFVKALNDEEPVQLTRNDRDCCPAWSPDGRSIAFSRSVDKKISINIVPSNGGPERTLLAGDANITRGAVDWSPDGKMIAFSRSGAISLVSLASSAVHRVTDPPPLSEDWGPAFSPDGQRLLFVRSSATGFPEEIMDIPTNGGEITRIASEHARILGPPRWTPDAQSIIFSSNRKSRPGLWRVSANKRDSPVEINDGGWYPAVSQRGYRLAYQRVVHGLHIWQMDLSRTGERRPRILIASSSETDQGPAPQFSPDGRKLAFMSDRSGQMEIWVSDRDGSNPFQVTALGGTGTPRWSPDSRSITFDVGTRNGEAIYAVEIPRGLPRLITPDGIVPSWSRDGKWIYFASYRTHSCQVWKSPAAGGEAVQVTVHGGHAALESADGKYLYYAKNQYANPEIWQVPVGGGSERLASPLIRPFTWASWAVVDRGILFAGPSEGKPAMSFFDVTKRRVTNLGVVEIVPFWLGATHDGKIAVFDQPGWQQAQVMLSQNFR